jgi:cytochrome c peroxidase
MNPTYKTLSSLIVAIGTISGTALAQGGPPPPLPPPPVPNENPTTPAKVVLGKILFFEEQLSSDDTTACATCHIPSAGYTDLRPGAGPGPDGIPQTPDDTFTSLGVIRADLVGDYQADPVFGFNVQLTKRRTPDVFGSLYAPNTFWDGRGTSTFIDPQTGLVSIPQGGGLESQAVGPPMSDAEMAHESRDWGMLTTKLAAVRPMALATDLTPDIVTALQLDSSYPELFENAFGTTAITAERVAFAIAAYERTLVPDQSPWDQMIAGNPGAMTPDQRAGWMQFNSIARCNLCHTPPFFTDNQFHNLGLRPIAEDNGRQGFTGLFADRGKFKTPSLRNAGLRQRFFHNGQAFVLNNGPTAGGVDDIYIAGGGPNLDNRDPLLQPLAGVPGINMAQIMDFVGNGLTDPRVAQALPPFDGPTLFSQRTPGPDAVEMFGPGNAGGNTVVPRLLCATPAVRGSHSFKVGLIDAPTTAQTAWLAISLGRSNPVWQNGFLLNLQMPLYATVSAPLQGNGFADGHATFHIDIPDFPGLSGTEITVQGFILDSFAAGGGSAASTRGASYIVP